MSESNPSPAPAIEPAAAPSPAPAAPAAPTVNPTPAPPPAAVVVVEGTKTEREIQLEKDLEEARTGLTKAQRDAAYAQDEARRLKEAIQPPPAPRKAPRDRWTLLHDPED